MTGVMMVSSTVVLVRFARGVWLMDGLRTSVAIAVELASQDGAGKKMACHRHKWLINLHWLGHKASFSPRQGWKWCG
jgi:hypothetical protein